MRAWEAARGRTLLVCTGIDERASTHVHASARAGVREELAEDKPHGGQAVLLHCLGQL